MSYLEQVSTEQKKRGLRMLIYGPPKIGKSTFGAAIPHHIFMNLENGLEHIPNVAKLPYTESYVEIKGMLSELASTTHKYKTLVVDSADMLETRISEDIVAAQNNAAYKSIADIPFGRGYPILLAETRKLLTMLEYLANVKGMNIVLLCHNEVKKVQPPVGIEYTQNAPSLFAKTTQGDSTLKIYTDWADIIGYCDFKTIIKAVDAGFGQKKGQAIGTGERVMYTDSSNPAYIAGSRFNLPTEIKFSWEDFLEAFNASVQKTIEQSEEKEQGEDHE